MSFTRLYLTNKTAPYTPATLRGAWDDTGGQVTRALDPVRARGGEITFVSRAETNASPTWDVLLYRGVSGPLAAQTISGTIDVLIGVVESSFADSDFYWHVHLYVTQGDSDTPRGDLLTDYVENTTNEWNTTAQGYALQSAQALSSLAVSAGDRLVVELGYIARNVLTASRVGALWYGTQRPGDLVDGDLTLGGDETTLAGHLIFSSAISEDAVAVRLSQMVVEVIASNAVSMLPWLPIYPDRAMRPTLSAALRPQAGVFVGTTTFAPPTFWQPSYPDRISRLTLRVETPLATPIHVATTIAPSTAGWTPFLPAWVERKELPYALHPHLFYQPTDIVVLPALPVPPLAWEGEYPALHPRPPLVTTPQPKIFQVPSPTVTTLEIVPTYPPWIDRRSVRAADHPFSFQKLEGLPSLLSWQGEQPDLLWPPAALHVARHPSAFMQPNPIAAPTPVSTTWTPVSVDRVFPPRGLAPRLMPTFVQNISPIPNAAPPAGVPWAPRYPEIPMRRLARAVGLEATVFLVPGGATGGDLGWLAQPADPRGLERRPIVESGWSFGAQLVMPTFSSWYPIYPDRARRLLTSAAGFFLVTTQPPIVMTPVGVDVVRLVNEAVTFSGLVSMDLTQSGLTDEDVTFSALTAQELA